MPDILVADKVTISGTKRDQWGRLVAKARIARDGIYEYHGSEIGGEDRIYRILRPSDEVFDRASLESFARAPVTIGHPNEPVRGDGAALRKYTVGNVDPVDMGRETLASGDHFTANLVIDAAEAIETIEGGERELSAGYMSRLDMTPGTDPKHGPYDGVMRSIVADHVAIVPRGRAGPDARIGDDKRYAFGVSTSDPRAAGLAGEGSQPTGTPSSTGDSAMTTRTITLDGSAVTLALADAELVERIMRDANRALETVQAERDAAVQARDTAQTDLAARDGTIEELRAQVSDLEAKSSPEAVAAAAEKMAKDRQGLEDMAKKLGVSNFKPTGDAAADRAALFKEKRGTATYDSLKERFGDNVDTAITARLDEMASVSGSEGYGSHSPAPRADEDRMTGDADADRAKALAAQDAFLHPKRNRAA